MQAGKCVDLARPGTKMSRRSPPRETHEMHREQYPSKRHRNDHCSSQVDTPESEATSSAISGNEEKIPQAGIPGHSAVPAESGNESAGTNGELKRRRLVPKKLNEKSFAETFRVSCQFSCDCSCRKGIELFQYICRIRRPVLHGF